MLDKNILQDLLKRAADLELEKQFYEKGNGFLSKPYENYRFHNGFIFGAVWMSKALEEAIEQRNAWMRDFYSGADLGQVPEEAIKLEDETLLEILRGK